MATGQIAQTEASFNVYVEDISKLSSFWPPKIKVQGTPWQFHIKKHTVDNEDWLAVFLHCKKDDPSRDWGVAALATFRLIPFRDKLNVLENELEPVIFDCTAKGYGFSKFIKWKNLLDVAKGYVENDTIKLNIKVTMADPNDKHTTKLRINSHKYCDKTSQTTLQLTVNDIDNLMAVRTPEFISQNLRWDLTVFKHSVFGLCLRVTNRGVNGISTATYKTKITFEIKSSIPGVQGIEKNQYQLLKPTTFNSNQIISWKELFKPKHGFVVNNSIGFEVKVKVDKVEQGSNAKKCAPNSPEALECAICLERIKNQEASSTVCGHLFCTKCVTNALRTCRRCPSCNTKVKLNEVHRVYLPFAKKD